MNLELVNQIMRVIIFHIKVNSFPFACNCSHVCYEIALVRNSSHNGHASAVTSLSMWPSCDDKKNKLLEALLQESNKGLHRKFVVLWLPQLVG
jgi:hypothetical protein